jgi:hypothetical protein
VFPEDGGASGAVSSLEKTDATLENAHFKPVFT